MYMQVSSIVPALQWWGESEVRRQAHILGCNRDVFRLSGALVHYMKARVNLISILISLKESHLLSYHLYKDVQRQGVQEDTHSFFTRKRKSMPFSWVILELSTWTFFEEQERTDERGIRPRALFLGQFPWPQTGEKNDMCDGKMKVEVKESSRVEEQSTVMSRGAESFGGDLQVWFL